MPSLTAARWVAQNSGPIFRRLWTKVHRNVCQCGSVRSLQRHFPIDDVLLRSADIRDQVVKLSENPKSRPNFDVFGPPFFEGGGEGPPKFLTEFFKSGSQQNMWQTLVTIGQAIRRQKERKKTKDEKI